MIAEGVLVPPRAAAVLAPVLRRVEADARRRGEKVPAHIAEIIRDLETVGSAYRAHCADATSAIAPPTDYATLTVTEAAGRLRCTESNVRALLNRGSLIGRRIGGRWLIDPVDLTEYQQRSKA